MQGKYFVTFSKVTIKHNNSLNLIIGCLYVSFFGLHVSVILMTIIRSVRAKEIAMRQRFTLNVMGSHYVLHCSVWWLLYYKIFRNIKIYKNEKDLKYGTVELQRRGVVFMTVLLRNTRTYLVGLRPDNLLSPHFHFYFHLSIYVY